MTPRSPFNKEDCDQGALQSLLVATHHHGDDDEIAKKQKMPSNCKLKLLVIVASTPCLFLFLVAAVFLLGGKGSPLSARLRLELIGSSSSHGDIPECLSSPWKKEDYIVGTCPSNIMKPYAGEEAVADAKSCSIACCKSDACISWQFRRDKGCLMSDSDIRIGIEKDGPSAWCSDHPPYKWNGQFISKKFHLYLNGQFVNIGDKRQEEKCNKQTWNPNEQQGQCFGLGDVKKDSSGNAEECMEACCNDENCGAWQFHSQVGCFYGKDMHSCQKSDDPVVFEPFIGRRKFQKSRSYTSEDGKPWKQMPG